MTLIGIVLAAIPVQPARAADVEPSLQLEYPQVLLGGHARLWILDHTICSLGGGPVTIYLDDKTVLADSIVVPVKQQVLVEPLIPLKTTIGSHMLRSHCAGELGSSGASTQIDIVAPPTPILIVSPASAYAGDVVTLTGTDLPTGCAGNGFPVTVGGQDAPVLFAQQKHHQYLMTETFIAAVTARVQVPAQVHSGQQAVRLGCAEGVHVSLEIRPAAVVPPATAPSHGKTRTPAASSTSYGLVPPPLPTTHAAPMPSPPYQIWPVARITVTGTAALFLVALLVAVLLWSTRRGRSIRDVRCVADAVPLSVGPLAPVSGRTVHALRLRATAMPPIYASKEKTP